MRSTVIASKDSGEEEEEESEVRHLRCPGDGGIGPPHLTRSEIERIGSVPVTESTVDRSTNLVSRESKRDRPLGFCYIVRRELAGA